VTFSVQIYCERMTLVGTVFTQNQFQILIGQKFSSTISFDPGSPTSVGDTYSWTLSGGNPFADYTAPPPTGPAVYTSFTPPTGASLNCYFAKPEPVTCQCVVTLPNAGGLQVTLSRQFATRAPEFDFDYEIANSSAQMNGEQLRFYGTTYNGVTVGIAFHGFGQTPSPWSDLGAGSWCWTQVVTSITRWYKSVTGDYYDWSENFTLGPPRLDTLHPYANLTFPADGVSYTTNDTPSIEGGSLQLYSKDYYKTYQLYKPPGVDSRFVPLRTITWNWLGHASRNSVLLPWNIPENENLKGSTVLGDFLPHPVWNQIVHGSGGTWIKR
jgi:hypothetical protein